MPLAGLDAHGFDGLVRRNRGVKEQFGPGDGAVWEHDDVTVGSGSRPEWCAW